MRQKNTHLNIKQIRIEVKMQFHNKISQAARDGRKGIVSLGQVVITTADRGCGGDRGGGGRKEA